MILPEADINAMSALALAHMGDAVFELMVRRELCRQGKLTAGDLHRSTISYVSAGAQARAARALQPHLSPGEASAYRRGRNARSHAAPKGVSEGEYHSATGLESLFGWLYLRGEEARLEELFSIIMEDRE